MRLSDSPVSDFRLHALRGLAAVLAIGLLAGCASSSGSSSAPVAGLFGGSPSKNAATTASNDSNTIEQYLQAGYCPPVEIRPGTETLVVYDRGHDQDPAFIRFQGSITKTARECHAAGSALMLKVGIAGRLTAGPKGAAGNFALPLRVAVVKQHGGNVFYSEVTKTPVTLTAPDYGADFSAVVDNISFEVGPDDRDLIIYVGYDEGKPKPPAPTG